jgi:DNA polymerase-3 subunit epsilon
MWWEPVQTTIADGVRLADVTFAVVDLETTGGSPVDAAITEIGAVRLRAGERLGTFQTLVDPCRPIPPYVAHLTGIDDRMVSGAPPIEAVLPSFLEFTRGTVFVAHNASFDRSFLDASLTRSDHPAIQGPVVCTAKLARRVVWPDVPNVRLATLARYFRTRARPTHRALADAEATAEVLQGLLDLCGHLGIETLGELVHACSARGRPNFGKIRLADGLPSTPGVYLFRGRDGRVLYVGKSVDVRARVRSYFYGDTRKKVQDLLEQVASVDALPTPGGEVEALALEARLIGRYGPSFNRRGTRWRSYTYLKLDPSEAWPRLRVVHTVTAGAVHLGPFPSRSAARLAKEALEEAYPIRRCTRAMGRSTRFAPCALADMGRCLAPCDGRTTDDRYGGSVQELLGALTAPGTMLEQLERRMAELAAQHRFEEASLARDRLRVLADALWRRRIDTWLTAPTMVVQVEGGGARLELRGGSIVSAHGRDPGPIGTPPPRERADELAAVRSWIARRDVRVVAGEAAPAEPVAGGRRLADLRERLRLAERPPEARRRRGPTT